MSARALGCLVVTVGVGATIGCATGVPGGDPCLPPPGASVAALVYGDDDRLEPHAHPDGRLGALARDAAVALVRADRMQIVGDAVRFTAPPLGEVGDADGRTLCPGEPFADQPSAAFCSGTLIDDDLVLTAGHCLSSCDGTRFVFGYLLDERGAIEVGRQDVFGCRSIVARTRVDDGARAIDYAIVQLDRPATPGREPADVSAVDVEHADPLAVIGFPDGIPAKVDSGGRVLNPRDGAGDYFFASTDTFRGSSGSGVFDARHGLVGVLFRGADDYEIDAVCGCRRVRRVRADAGSGRGELVMRVRHAIEGLCDAGWRSLRLCGRSPVCDDGVCQGIEIGACAADCPGAECGDGRCEVLDEIDSCAVDCGPPDVEDVPESFRCNPDTYAAGDGCHCDCGAKDPDCDAPGAEVVGCADAGARCTAAGRCEAPPPVDPGLPAAWACLPAFFGDGARCDCQCGAPDPDCAEPGLLVVNCGPAGRCSAAGRCVDDSVPEGWTCDGALYDAGDGCHCTCGVRDPDCDLVPVPVDCHPALSCDPAGRCVDPAGRAPAGWTCDPAAFGAGDACDCDCGAADPDCALPELAVLRCRPGQICDDGSCR